MRKTTMLLLVCAALAGRAQVPCKWTVDLSRAAPANWDCLRGETLELAPSFVSGRGAADLSGVGSATMYWQTNGMGAAYWSAPASVDTNSRPHRLVARWTPDCDCGAPAYSYFVGASSPSGIQYRAFGTVRMRGAPGERPNELPLPVPSIDFGAVAVTNAPWALPSEVDASIAAATNAIPRPDMGAYVKKSGAVMNQSATLSWPDNAVVVDDVDGIQLRGNLQLSIWEGGLLIGETFLTNGVIWGDSTLVMSGGASATFVHVRDSMEETVYGPFDIARKVGSGGWYYIGLPDREGRLALLDDIPQVDDSPYADPAPWKPSYALAPSETAVDTYVVTNGDSAATYTRDVVYQDALLDITIQDRPEPYTYAAPAGTWDIAEDAAGAASSIVPDGARARLVSSRSASGTVTARYSTPSNGEQTVSIWLSQTSGQPVKVGDDYDLPGTPRHAWQTNLLARLAAIDYSARHEYAHCYGGEAYGPEYIADALSPFNDLGESLAVPTGPNAGFFWPELASNTLPRSVVREDIAPGKPWQNSPVLFISPHWAVQAAHWNYAPTVTICTNYAAGAFVRLTASTRRAKGGGVDLALVRYRTAVPPQCIAKLVTEDVLREVSPSLFDKACGIHFSQHGTVHPFAVGGASAGGPDWTATGYDAATNACHLTHGGDSGQPIALVTPSAKVVWLACHHTVCGGPMLYDPENLAWIESILATDNEAPTYWTAEELMGE